MTTTPTLPRRAVLSSALIIAALLATGCGSSVGTQKTDQASGESTSLQNCGREVTVAAKPSAVVGMHPAQTEVLLRLGLADRLAGQAQASAQELPEDVAALAADVPVLRGTTPPSREDLLAVEPDFVYSPTTYEFTAEQGFASIQQLEQIGAAVYVATGGCFDRRQTGEVADLFTDLRNLGAVFDVEDTAAELISQAQAQLDRVSDAVADVDRLRVAQIFVDGTTLSAIGAGVEYDILALAGAENVYSPDQPAFAEFFAATITPESLAAQQPEAIVFSTYDADHEASVRAYLKATFPEMPAVRDGRVIAVSSSDVFPGTLGNVRAVRQIAEQLYPAAF